MARRQLAPRSLEREVYNTIREEILLGLLAPGALLIEGQLSAELGVSKTPVREALIRLQRDGLVQIAPYRGARVATPSVSDVRDAVEVRTWIETQIARQIAREASPELLREIEENIERTDDALERGDDEGFVKTVLGFSELLLDASGNRYAKQVVESLRNVLALIANASRTTPGRRRESIDEHRAIFAAIAAGDADAAEAATRAHLESIKAGALQALEVSEARASRAG